MDNTTTTPSDSFSNSVFSESSSDPSVGMSWMTWVVLILVLAFFGFNLFLYLAQGTQLLADATQATVTTFAPLLRALTGTAVETVGQTVSVTAGGAKALTGVVDAGLTTVQQATDPTKPDLQNALNTNTTATQSLPTNQPEPHEAGSTVATGKHGWCFVGKDHGFRTCAEVGVNDMCMSGDIFPSQAICVNPSLRM